MKKLVIAIDCDDVLVNASEFLVQTYNARYGTSVQIERAHQSGNDEWGADRDEVFRRIHEIQLSDAYAQIAPSKMARRVIAELASHHELHVVSARHDDVLSVTNRMLEQYFIDCFQSVEHVGDDRSKGEVCEQLGAQVMIDDNSKHLIDAAGHGVAKRIWFGDYAWQKDQEIDVTADRCLDWREAQAVIEEFARG